METGSISYLEKKNIAAPFGLWYICDKFFQPRAVNPLLESQMKPKTTILVIEDDIMTLESIVEGLNDKGFDVISAASGIEALRILESTTKQIKVIILDWMMPEMSGLELLGLIKEDEDFRNIPVIMQTAKTQSEFVVQGIDHGAYQYLTKPFDDEVLFSMVRSAVAEFDRFQAIALKAERQVKDIRSSLFRERIRWRTP